MARGWHARSPKTYLVQNDNLVTKFYIVWHLELIMFLEIPQIEISPQVIYIVICFK